MFYNVCANVQYLYNVYANVQYLDRTHAEGQREGSSSYATN